MFRKNFLAVTLLSSAVAILPQDSSAGQITEKAVRCRAAVLVYHHIGRLRANPSQAERNVTTSPAAFERHMKLLKDEAFSVIPYDYLVSCMSGGPATPPKAVVITFDDGLKSQYTRALPILEKYGHEAIFFVVTDFVGSGSRLLDWNEVLDLERRGMVIGSHTKTHPWLTRCTDERLGDQLRGSKSRLESELDHPVGHLAYPFGAMDDRVKKAAAEAGYRSARSISRGTDHVSADLFGVRIVYVTDSLRFFRRAVSSAG